MTLGINFIYVDLTLVKWIITEICIDLKSVYT